MNKKLQRRKEYEIALNLVEKSSFERICWVLNCNKNPSEIGCPIKERRYWDELNLFFDNNYQAYFPTEFGQLSRQQQKEIRITILLFCIEMTR